MAKRLQVLLEAEELTEIRRHARRQRLSVSEWVRSALRQARATAEGRPAADRLRVLRAGARHAFPTATIDEMLAEIERGYAGQARQ